MYRIKPSMPRRLSSRAVLWAVALTLLASPVDAAKKRRDKVPPPEQTAAVEEEKATLEILVEGMEKLEGLVNFYRSPEKLYLELPSDLLGAPLGFSTVRVNAVGDFAPRGATLETQVVVWDRAGDHLVLTKKNLAFRADPDAPIHAAVRSSFPDSPAFQARLEKLDDDPAPLVIDASRLFGPQLTTVLPERLGYSTQPDEALLISLKAFEDNVVARVRYRFQQRAGQSGGGDGGGFARFAGPSRLADQRSLEVVVDYNLYRLPDDGYRPRFADERIGGFTLPHKDYTDIDNRDSAFRHLLIRWDVRKRNPIADWSPAVEPITFYLDRSVPEKWRPLVREATLWWNHAFESVGIQDAIQVLDQPDDPDWDPADIHHSMIYWNLSDNLVFSGMAGPDIVDPRTGKVLKANAYLNAEFFSYSLHRYLVYAWWRAPSPGGQDLTRDELREMRADSRFCDRAPSFSSQIAFARMVLQARGILKPGTPEAERFAREAFMELVSHEIGHALGFPHNWKASLVSDADAVASGDLNGTDLERMFSSSVMDYNPIYLAPKGKPQGDYFLRRLGAYDYLTVDYIYNPLFGMSPEAERVVLDAIAARAEVEPGLVYDSGELGAIDPTSSADDFGDDPLRFADTRLTVMREEVLPRLHELVLGEGHDYTFLRESLDSAIFSVAMDYIDMSARYIGGQILHRRVANSPASPAGGPPPIQPIPAAEQRRALEVLDRHVFADGAFSLSPETMQLMKANLQFDWNYPWRYASDYDLGSRIAGLQDAALSTLLEPARLRRVLDNERRLAEGEDRFTLPELFSRLQESAFADTAGNALSADRRSLQRLLVGHLIDLMLQPEPGSPAEASQIAATRLRAIEAMVSQELRDPRTRDGYTHSHLEDLRHRVRRALAAGIQLPLG